MPVSHRSSPEGLIYGVAFAGVVGVVFYLAMIANASPSPPVENYANFGSVGHKLTGHMAPQEYAKGITIRDPRVRNTGAEVALPSDIPASASSALSASSAVILSDMNISEASIQQAQAADPAQRDGSTMDDIRYATKGDGQIRPVVVNQNAIDNELVKLAMFENQDFMYHLESPIFSLPHLQDPSMAPPKSMFRPMTYPLVWAHGELGMDVIGNSDDTRVTISFTDGRSPNM